jgi:hypothetical protein
METTRRVGLERRRWLQLALAAIWILDGMLQFQPFMFTTGFAKMFVGMSGGGNPGWMIASNHWAWTVVARNPVLTNTAFATLQVGLGLSIAWRRTLRFGLVVSALWAMIIWWFGEDLGGLLAGTANILSGAPGAALLYAILALLLWPTDRANARDFVASRPVGSRVAKTIWLVPWLGLAALNLQPANLQPESVRSTIEGADAGQAAWLRLLITATAELTGHHGIAVNLVGGAFLALIGIGIFLPLRWHRLTIIAALVASALVWLIGQALGALVGGEATDPNSAPLLAIIALAYWPRSCDTPGLSRGARGGRSANTTTAAARPAAS